MEAAAVHQRSTGSDLPGDKAGRIVEAMRASVAERGIAGSTFDRVAREAGVSRGLLHYYFGEGSTGVVTFYELFTVGQRNQEIAAELSELARTTRERLADALRAHSQDGVLELRAAPVDVANFLFALADGVTVRRLSEPELDTRRLMDHAVSAARALLA